MAEKRKARHPASNPADREQQMIELADSVAEKQMLAGTASPTVITHYLKRGSLKDQAELERIELEKIKLKAQIAQIEQEQNSAELMDKVMRALKSYNGEDVDE